MSLVGPKGTVKGLKVVYLDNFDLPSLVTPALLEKVTKHTEVRTAWLRLGDGVDRAAVLDKVGGAAVLAGQVPVGGPALLDLKLSRAIAVTTAASTAFLAVALLVAVIGAVLVTIVSVAERWHEHAVLRALGLERPQLRRLLLVRTQAVALAAAVVGIALGLLVGLTGSTLLTRALHIPAVHHIPLLPIFVAERPRGARRTCGRAAAAGAGGVRQPGQRPESRRKLMRRPVLSSALLAVAAISVLVPLLLAAARCAGPGRRARPEGVVHLSVQRRRSQAPRPRTASGPVLPSTGGSDDVAVAVTVDAPAKVAAGEALKLKGSATFTFGPNATATNGSTDFTFLSDSFGLDVSDGGQHRFLRIAELTSTKSESGSRRSRRSWTLPDYLVPTTATGQLKLSLPNQADWSPTR